MAETLKLFTARDAKAKFGEVLDTALGEPVGITKHDRLTAYLISKMQYERLLSKVEELQDELWLAKAQSAREEGFMSAEETNAFLTNIRKNLNAFEQDNEAGG